MNITPVRPGTYDVHIVPQHGAWGVEVEGENFTRTLLPTQYEAIAYGVRLARESAALLLIHGRDGQFRDVRNYG